MRYLFLLFTSLLLCATPVKIATYNVENLFDTSFQGTEYEEYIPGKHNWNRRMLEIKLNHIAEVICDVDADILALQEIENKAVLLQLKQKLKRVGCAYSYSAITHKREAPIQVALLSRYALKQKNDIQVSYAPRVRNILEVEVDIGGVPLTLFVNHWKSKAYYGYESKRIAYAKALQKRIARLARGKEYILLGDFNSDYNAYLTLESKNNDTHGRTAFNDVLKTKVGKHLVNVTDIRKASKGVHYSLWHELPMDERWSHTFYGTKSSLDHIVVPQAMFDGKGIDYVPHSFKVFKAPYLFTKRGYLNRWRYKNGKHRAKGYSDHLPIYAYFDTKPYKARTSSKIPNHKSLHKIEDFYKVDKLTEAVMLHNVLVIMKRGNHAIVKQSKMGRGIMLYGCAKKLKEGYRYDLLVEGMKTYYGLKEITHAYIRKEKEKVTMRNYYLYADALVGKRLRQNEVLRNVRGIYKNKFFYMHGQKIPIFFKNKKLIPKNGSKLKISYAHVGYYKKLQLVIYSKKDFEQLEH